MKSLESFSQGIYWHQEADDGTKKPLKRKIYIEYCHLRGASKSSFLKISSMRVSLKSQILLLFIMLLGTYLRFSAIQHPLMTDELATSWVCSGSFLDLLKRWDVTALSPLYYCIIYVGKLFFGYSEIGLRIPNVIFGVLTIPLVYSFTNKLTQNIYGSLIAAFIVAVDFDMIHYSLLLRAYSIIVFFALVHIYFLYSYLAGGNRRIYFICFILSGSILLWLHYTTFPIFIIDFIVLIFWFYSKGKFKQLPKVLTIIIFSLAFSFIPLIEHTLWLNTNSDVLDSFIQNIGVSQMLTIHPQLIVYLFIPFLAGITIESVLNYNRDISFSIHPLPASIALLGILVPIVSCLLINELLGINLLLRRYLIWTVPFVIIAGAMSVIVWKSIPARIVSISLLVLLSLWPYKSVYSSFVNSSESFQASLKNYILRYDIDAEYWKTTVHIINNLSIEPSRIYVFTPLVEKEYLSDNKPDHTCLRDYLLSVVNSLYPLKENLLDSCVVFNSGVKIDRNERNIIIIGSVGEIESTLNEMSMPVQTLYESKARSKILFIP